MTRRSVQMLIRLCKGDQTRMSAPQNRARSAQMGGLGCGSALSTMRMIVARGRLGLAAVAAGGVLLAAAPAAQGAVIHHYMCQITGTTPGSATECHTGGSAVPGGFVTPNGMTVSGGDLWVTDKGNEVVDKFDASGAFASQIATGASGGYLGSIAVNNSTQDMYVTGSNDVYVFDNTGARVADWNGSTAPTGSFTGPFVAVDNSSGPDAGDVYVGDSDRNILERLDPTGNPAPFTGSAPYISGAEITGTPSEPFRFTGGDGQALITVDASGNIYVVDSVAKGGGSIGVVDEFDQTGMFVRQFTGADLPGGEMGAVSALAIDDATGNLYVGDSANGVVDEFSGSGTAIDQLTGGDTPEGSFTNVQGLAVDPLGDVYVSNSSHSNTNVIDEFGPDILVPDATTGQASNATQTGATLSGTVNPSGVAVTDCHFEYVDNVAYQGSAQNPYAAGQTAPCAQAPTQIGSGSSAVPVSADISGLKAGTLYHFRLVAANANGAGDGLDQLFATVGLGFGFASFDGSATNQDGSTDTQAGSHPYEATTIFTMNPAFDSALHPVPSGGDAKDLEVDLPAGFVGDPNAVPQCTQQELISFTCPDDTAVGYAGTETTVLGDRKYEVEWAPIYNVAPPPGVPAEFGFVYSAAPIRLDASVRTGGDYGLDIKLSDINQTQGLVASTVTFWATRQIQATTRCAVDVLQPLRARRRLETWDAAGSWHELSVGSAAQAVLDVADVVCGAGGDDDPGRFVVEPGRFRRAQAFSVTTMPASRWAGRGVIGLISRRRSVCSRIPARRIRRRG